MYDAWIEDESPIMAFAISVLPTSGALLWTCITLAVFDAGPYIATASYHLFIQSSFIPLFILFSNDLWISFRLAHDPVY